VEKLKLTDLYSRGFKYPEISNALGIAKHTAQYRIKTLIRKGELKYRGRSHLFPISNDDLVECYLKKNWGITKISKEFNCSWSSVRNHLVVLGILDSSRQFKKKEGSRRQFRRPRSAEFKDSVKRLRFEEEAGICELCGKKICEGINWKMACYHHKEMISNGGDGSADNCQVLHRSCHEDNFEMLHGFPYSNFSWSNQTDNAS